MMLILSREIGESVVMPDSRTRITILSVSRRRVRVGIDAPADVAVHREETWRRIRDRVGSIAGLPKRAPGRVEVLWLEDSASEPPECVFDPLPDCPIHFTVVKTIGAFIEQLVNRRPDLLVVDLDAECGHPQSVLQFLRRDIELSLIPVILIGSGTQCLENRDLGISIIDRLRKPMDRERLAEGMRALFSYSNWRSRLHKEESHDGGSESPSKHGDEEIINDTSASSLVARHDRCSGDNHLAAARTHLR